MKIKKGEISSLIPLYIFSFVSIIFILLPIIVIIGFQPLKNILDVLKEEEFINSLILTFKVGIYSTLFGIIFGTPLAYLIARKKLLFTNAISTIIDIPIIIPHPIAGIALLFTFGPSSPIFKFLGINIVGKEIGITIAMAYISISLYINTVKVGIQRIPYRYEEFAHSLGHSHFSTFLRVIIPMAFNSVKKGAIVMWTRGISEFGAIIIIAYNPKVISVLAYNKFEGEGIESAAGISAILIIIVFSIFIVLNRMVKER